MSCIMHGCLAIALESPQSMEHSFAATCSVCNGLPPASKSGPDNFETLPDRRADVSSASVDLKLHDSANCTEGTPVAVGTAGIRKSGKLDPNCRNLFPEKRF
jgi:hypothetical protein